MAGYSADYSMSNNALAAYDDGLLPASKIGRVPAALIEKYCHYAEWHHASKAYNRVKFYNPAYVFAVFGLETHEDFVPNPTAVAALAAYKAGVKDAAVIHQNCSVQWIEWSGSLRRPKATECRAEGCVVSVKGQIATITLPDGRVFTKRLKTNGFYFRSVQA